MSVQEINKDYTQQLQDVEDSDQATQLQQEAQGKIQDAISEAGMSIAEYRQIANRAGQDEQLRQQIEDALTSHIENNSFDALETRPQRRTSRRRQLALP